MDLYGGVAVICMGWGGWGGEGGSDLYGGVPLTVSSPCACWTERA